MKSKIVSYYKPCTSDTLNAIDLNGDGKYFHSVTEEVNDKHLLDAVRLADMIGGLPWRDGDGVSPDTRYGIKELN